MQQVQYANTWQILKTIVEKKEVEMAQDKIKEMIVEFLAGNPSEAEIEEFYGNKVLPVDKRSINEILTANNSFKDICRHSRNQ